jgi:hypothetical protein
MPESYPGENLMCAEILANNTDPELSRKSMMFTMFILANNLTPSGLTHRSFDQIIAGLQKVGAMEAKMDLTSFADDVTFSAFMEKLFHEAFRRALKHRARDVRDTAIVDLDEGCEDLGAGEIYDKPEPIRIVRWLLKTGQNRNAELLLRVNYGGYLSPMLGHSLRARRDDLVQLLLGM